MSPSVDQANANENLRLKISTLRPRGRLRGCYLASLNGLTTPRSRSMKRCASGLGVLPFNVMIPIGRRVPGNSKGNALMDAGLPGRVNEKRGSDERKRPVASNLLRRLSECVKTVARGGSTPLARNACAIMDPAGLSNGSSTQRSFTNSAS